MRRPKRAIPQQSSSTNTKAERTNMSSRPFDLSAIRKQIGQRIRAFREARNWLQKDLSRTSHLPVRTIGRIERGEVDVRFSTLEKIATALGCNLKKLV